MEPVPTVSSEGDSDGEDDDVIVENHQLSTPEENHGLDSNGTNENQDEVGEEEEEEYETADSGVSEQSSTSSSSSSTSDNGTNRKRKLLNSGVDQTNGETGA